MKTLGTQKNDTSYERLNCIADDLSERAVASSEGIGTFLGQEIQHVAENMPNIAYGIRELYDRTHANGGSLNSFLYEETESAQNILFSTPLTGQERLTDGVRQAVGGLIAVEYVSQVYGPDCLDSTAMEAGSAEMLKIVDTSDERIKSIDTIAVIFRLMFRNDPGQVEFVTSKKLSFAGQIGFVHAAILLQLARRHEQIS